MFGPRRLVPPLLILHALLVVIAPVAAAQTRPAQGLTEGAELFAAGCAGCHVPQGSGAGGLDDRL